MKIIKYILAVALPVAMFFVFYFPVSRSNYYSDSVCRVYKEFTIFDLFIKTISIHSSVGRTQFFAFGREWGFPGGSAPYYWKAESGDVILFGTKERADSSGGTVHLINLSNGSSRQVTVSDSRFLEFGPPSEYRVVVERLGQFRFRLKFHSAIALGAFDSIEIDF